MEWYWWVVVVAILVFCYLNIRIDAAKYRGEDWTRIPTSILFPWRKR